MYVQLKKGHSYRFQIRLHPGYTLSSLNLDYYDQLTIIKQENIVVGGLRIAEVVTNNGKGKIETKKYHYGTLDCLDCDSGKVINRNLEPAISTSETFFCYDNVLGRCVPTGVCGTTTLSANTVFPIYGIQGYHIGYQNVIEEIGEDFEFGAVEHQFENNFSIAPSIAVYGNFIVGLPVSNFFNFGREKKKIWYAKNDETFTKIQEVENLYTHNTALDKETNVYIARRHTNLIQDYTYISNEHFIFENTLFQIGQYFLFRQWHTLSERITKKYDTKGENPSITSERFFYDNELHLQQTRTEITDSNGDIIKTQTKYPQDLSNRTPAEQQLIDLHQINTPIEVISTIKETGINEKPLSTLY